LGDWRSRYDNEAWRVIRIEAAYLFLLLVMTGICCLLLWIGYFERRLNLGSIHVAAFRSYGFVWFGGTLGGLLVALKWQYHSVAKQLWNFDRILWRLLTPHISGALAFASLAIFETFSSSTILTGRCVRSLAFGVLVGLFSDNALAKLTEIAVTLFGTTKVPNHQR